MSNVNPVISLVEDKMKRLVYSLGGALLVCLAWMPAQAEVLYDGFNGAHIDSAKWIATPMCADPGAYDCVREVRLGHLRLAVRKYGAADPSEGETFAESGLRVKQSPETIDGIRFRFRVTSFSGGACSSNEFVAAHPQLLAHGAFFNSGDPTDPNDDVIAYLMVERRTDDTDIAATALRVGGFMTKGNDFFNNDVDLGTVRVGEPAVATLKWDRDNAVVVWRVVRTFTQPYVVEVTRPSFQGPGNAPADPFKSFRVGTFVPNCTTEQSFAAMDALIDTVWVNP
jgi:hypothetical protein